MWFYLAIFKLAELLMRNILLLLIDDDNNSSLITIICIYNTLIEALQLNIHVISFGDNRTIPLTTLCLCFYCWMVSFESFISHCILFCSCKWGSTTSKKKWHLYKALNNTFTVAVNLVRYTPSLHTVKMKVSWTSIHKFGTSQKSNLQSWQFRNSPFFTLLSSI